MPLLPLLQLQVHILDVEVPWTRPRLGFPWGPMSHFCLMCMTAEKYLPLSTLCCAVVSQMAQEHY